MPFVSEMFAILKEVFDESELINVREGNTT
jgi:hypothetical protein